MGYTKLKHSFWGGGWEPDWSPLICPSFGANSADHKTNELWSTTNFLSSLMRDIHEMVFFSNMANLWLVLVKLEILWVRILPGHEDLITYVCHSQLLASQVHTDTWNHQTPSLHMWQDFDMVSLHSWRNLQRKMDSFTWTICLQSLTSTDLFLLLCMCLCNAQENHSLCSNNSLAWQ